MHLSRIELGPQAAQDPRFWREVSRPYGAHQALWGLFGRTPEQRRDFLFRAEEGRSLCFLVLSAEPPAPGWDGLWRVQTKTFAPQLHAGQRLGFRLRASPVVRRAPPGAEKPRRGTRHDVVMDRVKQLEGAGTSVTDMVALAREAGLAWLDAQGKRCGFALTTTSVQRIGEDGLLEEDAAEPSVRVDGYRQHRIARRGESPIRFSTLDFEGVLEVRDPVTFLERVRAGFGPQKAFGCGLMLLRRA